VKLDAVYFAGGLHRVAEATVTNIFTDYKGPTFKYPEFTVSTIMH
jgi:hypothetical protein